MGVWLIAVSILSFVLFFCLFVFPFMAQCPTSLEKREIRYSIDDDGSHTNLHGVIQQLHLTYKCVWQQITYNFNFLFWPFIFT